MPVELSGHYSKRRLLRTVAPSVLMMLISSVYGVIDGLFVSNFAGKTNFAAINLVWPAIMVVASLGIMVGTGGSALVAKTKGEGKLSEADRIFSMLIEFAILLGVILGSIAFLFMPTIVGWLKADAEMIYPAVLYGRILVAAMPVSMLQMAFTPFFMTAERPDLGTKFTIICGIVNIVFDALFIGILKWGVAGAAIATIMAQAVGGIGPLIYFSTRRNHSSLHLKLTSWHRRPISKACLNGSSEFVANISFSVVSICYNLQLMNYLGQEGVAAYGVIMYSGMIFYSLFMGYNIGVSPIIAYNYGAQNHAEMHSLLRKSVILVLWCGVLMTLLSEICARPMAQIFVGYDTELWNLTTRAIRIYMLSFLLAGYNAFASAFFTALNNGLLSAAVAFGRSFFFEIGCVFLLPILMGSDGIWSSVVVAEVLCFFICIALIMKMRHRYGY